MKTQYMYVYTYVQFDRAKNVASYLFKLRGISIIDLFPHALASSLDPLT